jgi:hypothetical protein
MTKALAVVALVVALIQVGRVSVFMRDPARQGYTALPVPQFSEYGRHSCYSAYVVAAAMARAGVANVYQETAALDEKCVPPDLVSPRFAASLGCRDDTLHGLALDAYEYPPPFLLLPGLGLALWDDFLGLRTVWFLVELAIFVLGLVVVARWIGGGAGRAALWLAPAVVLSLPVLVTLQIGNFQLVAFALTLLALVTLDRGWNAAGGGVLAFVTLSKLYPGIFLVTLALGRRWRALAWTAAAMAALVALTYAMFGRAPFDAFLHFQLPRIRSGEAFPWLEQQDTPGGVVRIASLNFSPYGAIKKLAVLGVPGMDRSTANAVLWVYGLVVLAIAAAVARASSASAAGEDQRLRQATVWLALLTLASLRSPFVPNCYAGIGTLWLISLVLPAVSRRARLWLIAAFVALALLVPEWNGSFPDPELALAFDSLQHVVVLAVNAWALWWATRRSAAPERSASP